MADNAHVFTDDNFQTDVMGADKPVVVDLWAEWCAPCRAIGPIIEALAGELADTIKIGKLDIQANPQTPSQYGVTAIPTILLFNGGKEIGRIVGGGRSADDFKKEFSKAFGVAV
jgi:thioredoxin 1